METYENLMKVRLTNWQTGIVDARDATTSHFSTCIHHFIINRKYPPCVQGVLITRCICQCWKSYRSLLLVERQQPPCLWLVGSRAVASWEGYTDQCERSSSTGASLSSRASPPWSCWGWRARRRKRRWSSSPSSVLIIVRWVFWRKKQRAIESKTVFNEF